MLVALGIVAVLVLLAGVVIAIRMARGQEDEEPPASRPGDFVAPVSSGGYRFRDPDETQEEFAARIARENAESEKK